MHSMFLNGALKVIISGGQTIFWFKPDHEPIFLLFNPNLLKIMFFESHVDVLSFGFIY